MGLRQWLGDKLWKFGKKKIREEIVDTVSQPGFGDQIFAGLEVLASLFDKEIKPDVRRRVAKAFNLNIEEAKKDEPTTEKSKLD